ncbi:unnamed protein product [Didymodactylos carnosus]|uniref:Uncharacterized protein n=1 Tax=Didymodactylos carnosus TaxID=1234261 RepID=A0A814C9N1_9BILA|nr:unnamed protein product [Didymodactylos carnosus]CAF1021911.1 unnamed protein product [Didymodactylos carnosus]CAF3716249.1 unnamed protein product [Didymodactylos carnosus]CAF3790547.1 unnamed protein product [Didymodactylos carnosus]
MNNYYGTKLSQRSTSFVIPFGILLILLGTASIILSAIDISNRSVTGSGVRNVLFVTSNQTVIDTVPTLWSEQSIWPTFGKGIWVGLLMMACGILTFVTHREKTLITLYVLTIVSFITALLSLFLMLSSILYFQRYIFQGRTNPNKRTYQENNEVVLNALLFVTGALSFILSSILAILSTIASGCCQRQKFAAPYEQVQGFSQAPPPPAYGIPPIRYQKPYYG